MGDVSRESHKMLGIDCGEIYSEFVRVSHWRPSDGHRGYKTMENSPPSQQGSPAESDPQPDSKTDSEQGTSAVLIPSLDTRSPQCPS